MQDLKEPVFANDDLYYGLYLHESWLNYFMHEINSILRENLDVVEQILRAVMFENAEDGCRAENYLDAFICKRYAAMSI